MASSMCGEACQAQNIASIRKLFVAIGDGTFANVVAQLAAPNFVRHDLTGAIPGVVGQEGARNFLTTLKARFPDLHLEIEDIFASDDKVVVRFVAAASISEAGSSGPARIAFNNINIYRFENGCVAETWQLADALSLQKQTEIQSR